MAIIKAIKKPVLIEAVVWTGTLESFNEIRTFMDLSLGDVFPDYWKEHGPDAKYMGGYAISTLEGRMVASIGDYIIKGVNGEFYPCKPDIFEKTYEIQSL